MPPEMPVGVAPAATYAIFTKRRSWFVTTPEEGELGPYFAGRMALQVAVARLLLDRKCGLAPSLHIGDAPNETRACAMGEMPVAVARCDACHAQWRAERRTCPLRNALRASSVTRIDRKG